MDRLLGLLAREEQLLELLLHRLRVAGLLLATGRSRFLATTADEIHQVLDELATVEAVRVAEVAEVGDEHGAADPTLRALATCAAGPTRVRLLASRDRLRRLVAEVEATAAHSGDLATVGLAETRAALARSRVRTGGVRPDGAG